MGKNRPNEHLIVQKEGKELEFYTCMLCLKQFEGNHGHHLIKYSESGPAINENILTLCPDCHRKYHSGKINIDISRF
ncbi:hypothetical protein AGMMS50212_09820 [Spirochaetia bacterium]|nr:hypothetical protein AGMMS50212_09820 [Spirochaetia bacterium]